MFESDHFSARDLRWENVIISGCAACFQCCLQNVFHLKSKLVYPKNARLTKFSVLLMYMYLSGFDFMKTVYELF